MEQLAIIEMEKRQQSSFHADCVIHLKLIPLLYNKQQSDKELASVFTDISI